MFVFLQVLKLVVETTVKVKGNVPMEVSSSLTCNFDSFGIFPFINWNQRNAPKSDIF